MVLSFKTRINEQYTSFREKILTHLGMDAIRNYCRIAYLDYSKTIGATEAAIQEYVDHASVKYQELNLSPKKLTIRDDPHFRWQAGRKIHFATGARTKQYECFAIGECTKVSDLFFHFYEDYSFSMKLDGKDLNHEETAQLAIDDGFDTWEDFCAFHMPKGKDGAPFYPPNGWMRKRVIYF